MQNVKDKAWEFGNEEFNVWLSYFYQDTSILYYIIIWLSPTKFSFISLLFPEDILQIVLIERQTRSYLWSVLWSTIYCLLKYYMPLGHKHYTKSWTVSSSGTGQLYIPSFQIWVHFTTHSQYHSLKPICLSIVFR